MPSKQKNETWVKTNHLTVKYACQPSLANYDISNVHEWKEHGVCYDMMPNPLVKFYIVLVLHCCLAVKLSHWEYINLLFKYSIVFHEAEIR